MSLLRVFLLFIARSLLKLLPGSARRVTVSGNFRDVPTYLLHMDFPIFFDVSAEERLILERLNNSQSV